MTKTKPDVSINNNVKLFSASGGAAEFVPAKSLPCRFVCEWCGLLLAFVIVWAFPN